MRTKYKNLKRYLK